VDKKKTLFIVFFSTIFLLIIALVTFFFFYKARDVEDSNPELSSVYISDNNQPTQLQTDIESQQDTENSETINPSKQGELTTSEDRKVVTFNKDLTEEEKSEIETEYNVTFTDDQAVQGTYSIITNKDSNLDQLEENQDVSTIETDVPIKMFSDTVDWGITRIGASKVWNYGSGSGVTVAIIDTGIQLTHPDLSSNVISGYDFVNNDGSATDDNGHGTHVAGIVASTMNNAGNIGASYSAKLMPVKVLNESGYGYLSDVAKGVYYATDNGARVINMSLGSTYDSDTLRRSIQYASSKGVLIVAAAGNDSGAPCSYPAAYSSVICVVATDQDNKLASFSNIGGELAAPGVSNYSTYINNSYARLSGTSMASPHIAGSAALLMSACNDCSTTEVREILRQTATDLGAQDYDIIFGYGLVNLIDAIEEVLPNDENPTEETPTETPETEEPNQNENTGNQTSQERKENPNETKTEYFLSITNPETNPSRRYILRETSNIELKFEISPDDRTVNRYKIYLNNEEVENYNGNTTSYIFNIDDLKNIQYELRVEAILQDGSVINDSILLDLTHISRGRSVKGISDFRNWFNRLFFN
jgi:hypothetical protein